jgi:hypothetical protein
MFVILAALTACTVPFSTNLGSELSMGLELDQSCTGSDTRTDALGTTEFTLTLEGDVCRMDVVWSGQLVSQEDLDAEVDAALDGQPVDRSNVEVTGATFTMDRVRLLDAAGSPVTVASFPEWSVDLQIAGEPVYTDAGTDLPELLAAPVTVPLSAGQLAVVNTAVQGEGTVMGDGTAMLRVPVAALPETASELTIDFSADIALDAEVGL